MSVASTDVGAGGCRRLQEAVREMEAASVVIYEFFARKAKIIILTVLTYAALC